MTRSLVGRACALLSVAGWCTVLAAVIAVLAPGGPSDGWLADMPVEARPVAVALRILALVAALHLSIATAASIVGAIVPSTRRVAGALGSPTFVRRLAAAAIGVSLSAGPAVAGAAPPPTTQVEEPSDDAVAYLRRAPIEQPAPAGPRSWPVEPGDNLWAIARQTVAADLGRVPTDQEVHGFWRLLIVANRHVLADPADPDLIFPGQRFELPPPAGMVPLDG